MYRKYLYFNQNNFDLWPKTHFVYLKKTRSWQGEVSNGLQSGGKAISKYPCMAYVEVK
jgi:hypothetical protein